MTAGTPALRSALLQREAGWALAAAVAVAVAAGLLFAHQAVSAPPAALPHVQPLPVRGFVSRVLIVMTVLLVLRTAARLEADHVTGWLSPLFAIGASRVEYAIALVAATCLSTAIVFAAAAASFGVGVRLFGASAELVRALPATIGGGALLLGVYAVHAGLIGMLLRHSIATVAVLAVLIVGPYLLMVRHLLDGSVVPWWLFRLSQVVPPVTVPQTTAGTVQALLHLSIGGVLLAIAAHRYAGRQP